MVKKYCIFFVVAFLSSCANINQNYSLLKNHFSILKNARPISDIQKNERFNSALKKRLELIQEIKSFAIKNLGLKKTSSYSTYHDLGREAVVWNVLSVQKNSLTLDNWCYFIAGCFSYKGFYKKEYAESFSKFLITEKNREVAIIPIAAYSTLGWSDIFGGDPILNTFIWNDEALLVRLIIHEMSHQKVFVKNDTAFNESLATFVEEKGAKAWYENKSDFALKEYLIKKGMLDKRNEILQQAKNHLEILFLTKTNGNHFAQKKNKILLEMRNKLLNLYPSDASSSWIYSINLAWLAGFSLYKDYIPFFEIIFQQHGSDWEKFFIYLDKIEKLGKEDRDFLIKKILKKE